MEQQHIDRNYGMLIEDETGENHKVIDYVTVAGPNDRLVTLMLLDTGNYVITVTNPEESGRAPKQVLHMTKESFYCMMAAISLLSEDTGLDLEQAFESIRPEGGKIQYYSTKQDRDNQSSQEAKA